MVEGYIEGIAVWILQLANWGITILVIMLVIEIWKFFSFGTKGQEAVSNAPGNLLKTLGVGEEAKKERKTKRDASRVKTAALNDYVEEKKELDLISKALEECNNFATAVVKYGITPKPSKADTDQIRDKLNTFKDSVDAVKSEYDKLNKRTARQERAGGKLIKDLEDAEIGKKDMEKARAYESDILKNHNDVVQGISKVKSSIEKLDQLLKTGSLPTRNLEKVVLEMRTKLNLIKESQEKAYKEIEALIALFQKSWKP